jgi:hypothetical protein
MSDLSVIDSPDLDRLLALDAADRAKREKLSVRAFEREARKREERARAAAMNAELDAALDGVDDCRREFAAPWVVEPAPKPMQRGWDRDAALVFTGVIAGFAVMGALVWVFG